MITLGGILRGTVTTITLQPDCLLQRQLFTREGTQMGVAAARVRTRASQSLLCQNWFHTPIIAMYVICRQVSCLGNQLPTASIVLCAVSPEETVHILTSSAEDAITAAIRSVTPLSPERIEKESTHA
jgi:hypothetical protein